MTETLALLHLTAILVPGTFPASRRWRSTRASINSSPPRCIMRRLVLSALFAAALTMTFSHAPVAGQDKPVPENLLETISKALPDKAPVQPKQPRKILVY